MSHILHLPAQTGTPLGDPIQAEIFRCDPAQGIEPHVQTYIVPYYHRMSIFTLLREIYEHLDSTLAFRNQQCGRGICGNCQFRIGVNGKLVKGCTIPLQPGDHITIEPYSRHKVIRDLVVDN
jgi:succinate dehydrogenase/fumarate reductase-like Fe-S protein